MKNIFLVVLTTLALCGSLSGCMSSDQIKALAQDPSTVSVHQTFTGFGVNEQIDYVRDNSGKSGPVTAGSSGVTTPNGAAGTTAQATPPTNASTVK
jgi:hypothetical protein